MTRHDLGMTRFRQWWRRQYRSGYNGLDIATRFPGEATTRSATSSPRPALGLGWPLASLVGRGVPPWRRARAGLARGGLGR